MSQPSVSATLSQLEPLLGEVERATPSPAELQPLARAHRAGAVNLHHYLALRSHDLRRLQQELAELGLSSLGRAEGHVEATLRAVRRALRALAGQPPVSEQLRGPDFVQGRGALARNAEALLGPAPPDRAVRIMVTADSGLAGDESLVRALVERGMGILRINCAHDGPEVWTRIAANLRAAEKATGRACRILMDLGGPKIRTGPLSPGPPVISWKLRRDIRGKLLAPTTVWIVPAGARPPAAGPLLQFPADWTRGLHPGAELRFRDARGLRRTLRVVERQGDVLRAEAEQKAFVVPETRFHLSEADPGACPLGLPEPEMPITLVEGDRLVLTRSLEPGRAEVRDPSGRLVEAGQVGCTEPALFSRVRPGHRVLLDDGKFQAEAVEVHPDRLELRIVRGPRPSGKLASEKGINVPDTSLQLPALTDEDRRDLATVVKLADLVGMSFVQRPEDIRALRAELDRLGASHLGLILKIETTHAFAAMPALLLAAMEHDRAGVMIARGDLAVECGYQRLAEVQEELLWISEAAHVPAIWATQVLEGLAKNGVPSRAEVTDAAMGERAECVMLNKGPHILDAVSVLDDILRRMEEHQSKKTAQLRALRSWSRSGS
ncbi:MAG TPA: pyruvate kinase [Myxococcaceae bacterium]|nr:pyruvate kinase [Myxococcaceae bacterium]